MTDILLKRVYEAPAKQDGTRVLVDRLWPRGLTKEKAAIDLWLKDAAPTDDLRHWFHHDPDLWPEFRKRYRAELTKNPDALAPLHDLLKQAKPITLVFAAKDEQNNNAVVLRDFLAKRR